MFLRVMPKLHTAVRFLIQTIGEEHAEAAIQGKALKPPSKKLKGAKELADDETVLEVTRREVKGILVSLIEVDRSLRERLYVVQVACEQGWKMARNLSAVSQGKKQTVLCNISIQKSMFCRHA